MHFVHVSMIIEGGAFLGKGIFLENVIENIEMIDPNYYQKITIETIINDSY